MNARYAAYLESPHWRATRARVIRERGYRCEACDSEENIHVHHLTYERLGYERDSDLMLLCADCHAREHGLEPPARRERMQLRPAGSRPMKHIGELLGAFWCDLDARCKKNEVAA